MKLLSQSPTTCFVIHYPFWFQNSFILALTTIEVKTLIFLEVWKQENQVHYLCGVCMFLERWEVEIDVFSCNPLRNFGSFRTGRIMCELIFGWRNSGFFLRSTWKASKVQGDSFLSMHVTLSFVVTPVSFACPPQKHFFLCGRWSIDTAFSPGK